MRKVFGFDEVECMEIRDLGGVRQLFVWLEEDDEPYIFDNDDFLDEGYTIDDIVKKPEEFEVVEWVSKWESYYYIRKREARA